MPSDVPPENPALADNDIKAFWEVTKTITPGEKFAPTREGREDSTPEQTYGDGKPVTKGGSSSGGRTSHPVARPKRD